MKTLKIVAAVLASLFFLSATAQDLQADNMLLFQRESGGWSKQFKKKAFEYNVEFSAEDKIQIAIEAKGRDANIDNGSTAKEIRYLVTAYKKFKNPKYLNAAENGVRFLLKAQYENGGWPQYYPEQNLYRAQITYNDNAMINALTVLQDVVLKQNDLDAVNAELIAPSEKAIKIGIDCILKTQIKVDGVLTAWCQQYDEKTMLPAKARSYELPSISGSESVKIVEFLMSQPNPSAEIKASVKAAINWFNKAKIAGYKIVDVPAPGTPKGKNREVTADPNAAIWARFYEIETNRPFFCDRDGIKKYDIKEITYDARNGYSWYGEWPKNLLEKTYPKWQKLYDK